MYNYTITYSQKPSGSFDLAHKPYLIKHSSAVQYLICALTQVHNTPLPQSGGILASFPGRSLGPGNVANCIYAFRPHVLHALGRHVYTPAISPGGVITNTRDFLTHSSDSCFSFLPVWLPVATVMG